MKYVAFSLGVASYVFISTPFTMTPGENRDFWIVVISFAVILLVFLGMICFVGVKKPRYGRAIVFTLMIICTLEALYFLNVPILADEINRLSCNILEISELNC